MRVLRCNYTSRRRVLPPPSGSSRRATSAIALRSESILILASLLFCSLPRNRSRSADRSRFSLLFCFLSFTRAVRRLSRRLVLCCPVLSCLPSLLIADRHAVCFHLTHSRSLRAHIKYEYISRRHTHPHIHTSTYPHAHTQCSIRGARASQVSLASAALYFPRDSSRK